MSKIKVNPPVEHLPNPKQWTMNMSDLSVMIQNSALKLDKYYLWDSNYWFVTLQDWGKILRDVLISMPKYTTEKFDCEDFALLTTTRVTERYQINTCGIAVGASPLGEHGYNILLSMVENKPCFYIFEPQTFDFYPIEAPEGYIPRIIIFA